MTEVSTTDLASRPLAARDVQRFISRKHITGCAVCSHYNWQINEDVTGLQCGCESDPKGKRMNVIILTCQNCGALEFHDRGVIQRWLACHNAT